MKSVSLLRQIEPYNVCIYNLPCNWPRLPIFLVRPPTFHFAAYPSPHYPPKRSHYTNMFLLKFRPPRNSPYLFSASYINCWPVIFLACLSTPTRALKTARTRTLQWRNTHTHTHTHAPSIMYNSLLRAWD